MIQLNCLNRRIKIFFLAFTCFFVSISILTLLSDSIYAANSDYVSLQGKIVRNDTGYEGLNVVNGTPTCVQSGTDTCDFQVKYYSASSSGTLYLTETFSDIEIGDYDGVFNLKLGNGTVTTTSECNDGTCNTAAEVIKEFTTIYLEIGFAPLGSGSFTETFTRTALNASAYAIRSTYSEGSVADSFKFHTATNSSGVTGTTGSVYFDTTDGILKVYNGSSWSSIGSAGANAWAVEDISSWTEDNYLGTGTEGLVQGLTNFSLDTASDRLSINSDTTRGGLTVYSAYDGSSAWSLVSIKAEKSTFDGTLLDLRQDGTGDILNAYTGSTMSFQIDNSGGTHLANNGILYVEPFSSLPGSSSLNPNSGEGCLYSSGGNLYWDSACNASSPIQLGSGGTSLWTDGGTFTYLTATTDDLVLGASTTSNAAFFFDVSAGRLGIGTDSPDAALDIAGTTSVISNSSGSIILVPDDSLIVRANDTEDDVIFLAQDSTGSEVFRIDGNTGFNIGIGLNSLSSALTDVGNTAMGAYSLTANTDGSENVAVGYYALNANIAGEANVGVGANALLLNTSGTRNVAVGMGSLSSSTTTGYNTALGYDAGKNNTGSSNVFLGYKAGYSETGSNTLYISNSDTTTPLIYGLFTGTGAGVTIYSQATDGVPLKIKGASGQTSNLLNVENYSGTSLLNLSASGTMTLTGNFTSGTNNTYDIGSTSTRWNDVYAQGTIQLGADGDSGSIRYNTTDDQMEFTNDGTNWVPLGDVTKLVTLSAEYEGAVLSADGSSNTGYMTSDSEGTSSSSMNYYEWTTDETSLNDYDVRIRFTLPSDFVSWATTAFTFNFATEAAASTNNKADFYLYEESSASVDGSSTAQYSSSAGVWTTTTIAGSSLGDCNVAGETCVILIRMYSANDYYTRVGDIGINYYRSL